MKKWNCDVIGDLLPSYADKICSKESERIVEEHLAECVECRKLADSMKENAFESIQAEPEEIKYMKKIKKHISARSLINFGILIVVLFMGRMVAIGGEGGAYIPVELYYMLLPVLSFAAYYTLSDYPAAEALNRKRLVAGGLGILMTAYTVLLPVMCFGWNREGSYPFGMQPAGVGPFLYYQLLTLALLQAIVCMGTVIAGFRAGKAQGVLPMIHITGCCLALALMSLLKGLDTAEGFAVNLYRTIGIVLAEGVVIAIVLSVLGKRKRGQEKVSVRE